MAEKQPERKEKIIIIDDEKNVRDGCKSILEDEGWVVDTCADGEEGIEMIKKNNYDLVLVDLKMPGVGGIEAMHAIRGIDPSIMIVVITGYATVASAVDAMKQGAYDFIAKPFNPDQLIIVVRRALEKKEVEKNAEILRRQLEQLRMDFVAMVSHELRSPLASITQQLMALDSIEKIEKGRKLFNDVLGSLEESRLLVEDLLDVSRIEAGRMIKDKVPTDITRLIAEAVNFYTAKAHQFGVKIKIELPAEPLVAVVDPTCIRRVLDNLIDNAIKYSRKEGLVIITGKHSGKEICVLIEDNGIGIAPHHLPLIFERFYRVRDSRTRGIGGSGLGLSIVRGIVEAHNGRVEVESEEGKGSKFKIILPV